METARNFVGGSLADARVSEEIDVPDPATGELLLRVPVSGPEDVDRAVRAAQEAYQEWSLEPVTRRARRMFHLQVLLEERIDELAEIATRENGKHVEESTAEIRRGIEVVELAASMTTLMKGETLDQVSDGVDVALYREPLGVVTAIAPFNFPVMIPLWFAPVAVAAGNTFILKPSPRTPLSANRLAELFAEAGFPDGVFNVVHGARGTVEALIDHPLVRAVSSVGSAATAKTAPGVCPGDRARDDLGAARDGSGCHHGAHHHRRGIIVPHDDYMRTVEDICERNGALLIVDEVICGFGRTGRRFGYQHYGVKPDIITMAKGLTSAYFPLAATAVRREVYETFAGDGEYGRLRHINTFGGHPGGCAVALRNLKIMEEEDLPGRSEEMGKRLREDLTELENHPSVGEIRSKGLLFGIELVEDRESKQTASKEMVEAVVSGCKERGLVISKNADTVAGFNNVLTLAPPLSITEDDLEFVAGALNETLTNL